MAPSNRSSFTGTFRLNDSGEKEYNVTLDAWATVTGQSAANLKTWVRETVLPTLPVFLDWLSVPKNNGKTGGFTRDTVVESMSADFAFIKQSPEKFINSDEVTATTVQAHTAFIVCGHLMNITACAKHFNTAEEWNRGAFDFNKFLTKNMGDTRAFGKGKIATAEAARQKFVEDTQWRAADYLNGKFTLKPYSSSATQPPVSTNPLPVDTNAENNMASSSKSEQAPTSQTDGDDEGVETTVDTTSSRSPTSDITLRVDCLNSEGEGMEKTHMRKHDCNLAAFKTWAIDVFKMTAENEQLYAITVQTNVSEDEWKVTDTEQDWQLHIREACNRLSEDTTVNVTCIFDLVQGARGSWIETDRSRNLYYNGYERSLSTTPITMDINQELADLGKSAATMSIEETEAAMWAKAPKPDSRFVNNNLTFDSPSFGSASSYRADDVVPDRPLRMTATDLKRKHAGNDATPTPKRVKQADAASEGEHQIAAKRLWSDYVTRGGVSQAGVALSETEFMKKLPARFRKSKHPEMYCLEDFVYDLLSATETPVPSS